MLYHRRAFSIGPDDAVQVFVRRALFGRTPYVVFKEDPESPFKGALRAHFERFATHYHLELVTRGEGRVAPAVRFVFERPAWANGAVSFDAEWSEVRMELTATGYRNGRWAPLAPEVALALSGRSSSSCAES